MGEREMDMVERVARAICCPHGCDGDTGSGKPCDIAREDRMSMQQARAAIEAMREPTEAMLHAGFVAMNQTPSGRWKAMKAEGVTPRRLFDVKMAPRYRAMLYAALKSSPPPFVDRVRQPNDDEMVGIRTRAAALTPPVPPQYEEKK